MNARLPPGVKSGITGIERIAGWSDDKILIRCAQGHLHISMLDLPCVHGLQERGLVRAGQEMKDCLGVHMGDHSHIISGVPTTNAWVLITPKGSELAQRLMTAGTSHPSVESVRHALAHENYDPEPKKNAPPQLRGFAQVDYGRAEDEYYCHECKRHHWRGAHAPGAGARNTENTI